MQIPGGPSVPGFSTSSVIEVVRRKTITIANRSIKLYRVAVKAKPLTDYVREGLSGMAVESDATVTARIWLPLPVVQYGLPGLVKLGDEGPGRTVSTTSMLRIHLLTSVD